MKFRQHIPGGMELGDEEPFSFTFETTEELVSNEYVKGFTRNLDGDVFHKLSISRVDPGIYNYQFDANLMAEYNGGTKWWCVGYIDKSSGLNLPKWEPTHT